MFDMLPLANVINMEISERYVFVEEVAPRHNIGMKHCEEVKEILRQYRGPLNSRYGVKLSEETKEKLRIANTGVKRKESTKLKNRLNKIGTSYRAMVDYVITSPENEVHNIRNLTKFCKEYGLSAPLMIKVANGERKQHKSWTCKRLKEEK